MPSRPAVPDDIVSSIRTSLRSAWSAPAAQHAPADCAFGNADHDGLVQWAELIALPPDYALLMGLPLGPRGA